MDEYVATPAPFSHPAPALMPFVDRRFIFPPQLGCKRRGNSVEMDRVTEFAGTQVSTQKVVNKSRHVEAALLSFFVAFALLLTPFVVAAERLSRRKLKVGFENETTFSQIGMLSSPVKGGQKR